MRWIEPSVQTTPTEIRDAIGGHPIIAETLARRGIETIDEALAFIDPDLYSPASNQELPGVDAAVERLIQAKLRQESVCVWGDFDVDGQTATAVLVESLRSLHYDVSYHIPHRERESHGVNIESLDALIDTGVDLVITCDTGIGAVKPVRYASSRGVDFIVTDHHDLPHEMPDAFALVNPKFLVREHPLRNLPGVGVAYLVAERLFEEIGWADEISSSLDLVALGIVADLALQVKDVRYLLQRGLLQLRSTRRAGLKALMSTAGVDPEFLSEEQIAFNLGPRMNALGRLSDANPAVEFLLGDNDEEAMVFARKLESLNAQRRQLSEDVYASAKKLLDLNQELTGLGAIVLDHPGWPGGIVGLVAGMLADEFRKPVILLTHKAGGVASGSARSVEGIDISQAIAAQADILDKFGGHPMAAGLSLQEQYIPEFRIRLDRYLREELSLPAIEPEIKLDSYLPIDVIDLALVADLDRLAPFGPGNPSLVFCAQNLEALGVRRIGKGDDHLLVRLKTATGLEREAIWWNGDEKALPIDRFDLAYHVRSSSYRGTRDIQLEWLATRPHKPAPIALEDHRSLLIHDYRFHPNPQKILASLDKSGAQIWAEGSDLPEVSSSTRYELKPMSDLVLWTAPPDLSTLCGALRSAKPKHLHIFCVDPGTDSPNTYLNKLIGMTKYALDKKEGVFDLEAASIVLAQSKTAVVIGLEYLETRIGFNIIEKTDAEYVLQDTQGASKVNLQPELRLEQILREVAAFRALLRKVDDNWFENPCEQFQI